MSTSFPGFTPEALRFLEQLRRNNNREWFEKRKDVYERHVKRPMQELAAAVGHELEELAPGFETDPRKIVYRIHRDIRFSPNKSPYKTHTAAGFFERSLARHTSAGYYFHWSSEELLIGGGIYAPGPRELLAIRKRLTTDHEGYRAAASTADFRRYFSEIGGERLKRLPKGFTDEEHPAADLLRQKQFLAAQRLDPELVVTGELQSAIVERFRALTPWIAWFNEALRAERSRSTGVDGVS